MFFGATAFGQAPFGAVGEGVQEIVITPASHTLTLTLSNAYSVQKTHFVNGFLLDVSENSVTPQVLPVISGQSLNTTLNSPSSVTADGTIHLATGGGAMTITLGQEIGRVTAIEQGFNLTTATSGQQSVSGTALATVSGNSLTSAVGSVTLGPAVTAPSALTSQVAGLPAADTTFVVTVVNVGGYGNVFVIDGVQRPTLALIKGRKYIFDQSNETNGSHPLRFQTTAGTPITDGVVATGVPGQAGAKVEFTVPQNTHNTIRYYCTTHGVGMGNTISVTGTVVQLSPVAAVSGLSMTSSVNSVVPNLDVFLSGQSLTLSVNSVGLGYGVNVTGNSLTSAVGTISTFTFSDVDDTTTATIPLTPVDTTGAGGGSWTEVDETGAGTIEGEAA
tara:strand:- start:4041 stop:5207 length:1167 start_codon:yes stop_codon:yes gene_type:complete